MRRTDKLCLWLALSLWWTPGALAQPNSTPSTPAPPSQDERPVDAAPPPTPSPGPQTPTPTPEPGPRGEASAPAEGQPTPGGAPTPTEPPAPAAPQPSTAPATPPSTDGPGAAPDPAQPAVPTVPADNKEPPSPAVGEITQPPKLVEAVQAAYPDRAQAEGVEADVVLQIDVDAEGKVEAVSVLEPAAPSGYGFDEAAVAAASGFVFSPAVAGDTAVPVRITYRYRFTLSDEAQAAAAPAGPELPPPPPREPEVNLSGQLVERGTRAQLAGLTVTVFLGSPKAPEHAFEAVTDAEGRFAFYDLKAGKWNVLVEADGYYPVRSTETVVEGEHTQVRYYVERGAYNPFDVLVEADRPRREVSRTSLRIEQIERIPGTAGDALAVVQNLPGVARPAPLSGDILVRGAAPEDTRVVLEGMEIPIIYHFFALRSVIPTPMLKGIDFYPGNFSPEFGRAIGGIVDVRLKRLQPEHFGGVIDVSLLDANLYLEAPIGDEAAVAVAVRRSYIDALLNAAVQDENQDDVNLVTAPRYYDGQVIAQYRPSAAHELRAFGMFSDDSFELLFSDPGEGELLLDGNQLLLSVDFYRVMVDHLFTPSERFQNTLRVAAGQDTQEVQVAQFEYLADRSSMQLRDTARIGLADDLELTAGIDYLAEKLDYRVFLPPPPREGETPDFDLDDAVANSGSDVLHSFGAFAQLEWTLLEGLTLLPGVRFDYFSRVGESTWSPRASVRWTLSDQWVAKGGAGLFYQEPLYDETDGVFGNPDLKPEGATHYSVGVEWKPLPHLLFDVTGFYKDLFDLTAPSDRVVERDGELVPERVSSAGSGRIYGAELLLRQELNDNFMGWVAYTLMRSERRDQPGDDYRLFSRDQTHILTAVGTYRLPRNWDISLRFRLVSGNPNTPITGAIYNADRDLYEPVFGRLNSERTGSFHQLDLRIDKRFIWAKIQFSAYLDIQNIYNRANPEGASYSFDYSERETAQGLPILPILGLRAEY